MIFVVTTLFINEKEKQIVRTRTWGYFLSQEDAEDSLIKFQDHVLENGYYNYALIEKAKEGFGTRCEKIAWFKFDSQSDRNKPSIKKTLEPKFLRRYLRFWLG